MTRKPFPLALRPADAVLALVVFAVGVAIGVGLHLPAFQSYGVYKEDILQSPHWAAYHSSSFQPDDPIVRYASFNESPLQNGIYWALTWLVDYVWLSKILAVISYGALAAVFFLVGRVTIGTRFGLLLALFIAAFPDQWDYSAGFFSKFWAIPLLLICLAVLQSRRWKALIGLLPFAAIAYPSVAVLIGMTVAVYLVQEWFRSRSDAVRLFRFLAIGSALAVGILMVKYVAPPEGIGEMRSGAELRSMPELRKGGFPSNYIPIPSLDSEIIDHVDDPFVLGCAVIFFLVLGRGVAWERSWTAMFLASAIVYVLADLLFMRLYIPNRYTRYSFAVLLALWHARNWDLILDRLSWRTTRIATAGGLVAVGLWFHADSYAEDRGWEDRREMTPVSRFVREELPEGILIAGSPRRLDDLMIQARRSVLCPYKLNHPWFVKYYDRMRERTRATLWAHFAVSPAPVNQLHRRWGVTHFLVERSLFDRALRGAPLFAEPYNREIYDELHGRREFLLAAPPPEAIVWQDARFALVELPIGDGP